MRFKFLSAALFLLLLPAVGETTPITATFTAGTATGVFDNDGGWFGFDQFNVTTSWTIIVDTQPTEHTHFRSTLIEVDPASDDALGSKLHCVPPGSWTERSDGRYEATVTHTYPKISTYYGNDWGTNIVAEDPSCSAVSTSFLQLTPSDPLMQAITLQVGDYLLTSFSYGVFTTDFSASPLEPGSTHVILYQPQFGTLPFTVTYIGHPTETGVLTGLQQVPEPTSLLLMATAVGTWYTSRRRGHHRA